MAVPTPFDSEYKLDLAVAAALTRFWVENGLGTAKSMIKLCSAWGQGSGRRREPEPLRHNPRDTAAPQRRREVCGR